MDPARFSPFTMEGNKYHNRLCNKAILIMTIHLYSQ